jgi:hypothetical protein
LRAVLGQWAGGGLPLPQAKAPLTVALLVPAPLRCGWGRAVGMGGCIVGCAHSLEKTAPSFVGRSIHCLFLT